MKLLIGKKFTRRLFYFKLGILVDRYVLYLFGFFFGYYLLPSNKFTNKGFSSKEEFMFRLYLPSILNPGEEAKYIGI